MDDGRRRERQLGRNREIVIELHPKQRLSKIDGQALDRETVDSQAFHGEEWHGEEGEHVAGEILDRHQSFIGCTQAGSQEAGRCSEIAQHVVAFAPDQLTSQAKRWSPDRRRKLRRRD
jgi:hypothetical protein